MRAALERYSVADIETVCRPGFILVQEGKHMQSQNVGRGAKIFQRFWQHIGSLSLIAGVLVFIGGVVWWAAITDVELSKLKVTIDNKDDGLLKKIRKFEKQIHDLEKTPSDIDIDNIKKEINIIKEEMNILKNNILERTRVAAKAADYTRREQPFQAISYLQRNKHVFGENNAEYYLMIGDAYLKAENYDESLKYYKDSYDVLHTSTSMYNIHYVQRQKCEFNNAIDSLNILIDDFDPDTEAKYNIGVIYHAKKNIERAISYYSQVMHDINKQETFEWKEKSAYNLALIKAAEYKSVKGSQKNVHPNYDFSHSRDINDNAYMQEVFGWINRSIEFSRKRGFPNFASRVCSVFEGLRKSRTRALYKPSSRASSWQNRQEKEIGSSGENDLHTSEEDCPSYTKIINDLSSVRTPSSFHGETYFNKWYNKMKDIRQEVFVQSKTDLVAEGDYECVFTKESYWQP